MDFIPWTPVRRAPCPERLRHLRAARPPQHWTCWPMTPCLSGQRCMLAGGGAMDTTQHPDAPPRQARHAANCTKEHRARACKALAPPVVWLQLRADALLRANLHCCVSTACCRGQKAGSCLCHVPAVGWVRSTLVVDDLEEARQLCYGPDHHKVVSVDGTLFKPNGTFTGEAMVPADIHILQVSGSPRLLASRPQHMGHGAAHTCARGRCSSITGASQVLKHM